MFDIWIRAIKPGLATDKAVATYEVLLQEEPNPTLGKGVKWVAVAGMIAGAIGGFLGLIFGVAQGVPAGGLFVGWIVSVILVPIEAVIGFVIGSAILLAIAKALGGQGNLGSQSYVLAAAQAPMTIISVALGTIPVAGDTFSGLAGIYAGWLGLIAMRAAHRYGWGKAVLTVLMPVIVVIPIICLLLLLGPVVGNVFSNIVGGLEMTPVP